MSSYKKAFLLFVYLMSFWGSKAQQTFVFVPNKGQWDERVLYKSEVKGGALFLEKNALTFSFYDAAFFHNMHEGIADSVLHCHAFQMEFLGANPLVKTELSEHQPTLYNYYLGNDPQKWASGIKGGYKVHYENIYPKIHLDIYSKEGSLKYEFLVLPGGNPHDIKIKIKGADKLELLRGDLQITTSVNQLIDKAPFVYQGVENEIKSSYFLQNDILTFSLLSPYQRNETLIIDPDLIFSTYSGSTANNFGYTATYDDQGFLYAGGSVFAQGYPTTLGAYDLTFNSNPPTGNWGVSDLGITKYDTSGTIRIYSTYIGGRNSELPHSLIVNENHQLFIFGTTGSDNYPITVGAYDNSYNGGTPVNLANGVFVNYQTGTDIFISKLSADGSALLASTYYGGSGNDGLNQNLSNNYADQMRGEIIMDNSGNVLVATSTRSNNIPITTGAVQSTFGGGQDGIVFKMNSDLTSLVWSSYFGGSSNDAIYSIIQSADNNLFLAGGTRSNSLPFGSVTSYQSNFAGGSADGFFAKISNNGNSVLGGSYYGSDSYDQIYFIREDKQSNIYLFGQSDKYGSFYINNALYGTPNSGQFISKFSSNLTNRVWSTSFGSGNSMINISPTAFMVDLCNNVYLSGWGSPDAGFDGVGLNRAKGVTGMEVTADAYKSTTLGSDFYLMVLKDDASSLVYGSFYGGNQSEEHVDGGTSRFDKKGVMYQSVCAGCGGYSDFPIKPSDAVSPTNNASCNNGVFKFDFKIPSIVADFIVPEVGCASSAYRFTNTSKTLDSTSFFWEFGDDSTSTEKNPSHQFANHGTYVVKLIIRDPTSCNLVDSISKTIVLQADSVYVQARDTVCEGDSLQINISNSFLNVKSYQWSPGKLFSDSTIINPKVYIDSSQTLILKVSQHTVGCIDSLIYPIYVPKYILNTADIKACKNDSIKIGIQKQNELVSYQWSSDTSFADTLNSSIDSADFWHLALMSKTFYLKTLDKNFCPSIDSIFLQVNELNIDINADTIICKYQPQIGRILSHSKSQLDSISWSPAANVVSGADSTYALLNLYAYMSEYFVFARDSNLCLDRDTLRIIDNSLDYELPDTTICYADTLQLGHQLDYNPLFTYEWIPAVVGNKDSLRTYLIANDSIQLILVVNNSFCIDSVPLMIHVNKINIESPADTIICNNNSSILLSAMGNDTLNYTWYSPNYLKDTISSGVGIKNVNVLPNEGSNVYYVLAEDQWGCIDSASTIIKKSSLELTYPNEKTLCLNDTLTLQPNENLSGMGVLTFAWSPDELILTDTTLSKVKVYADPGSYLIKVHTENSLACSDDDTIKVYFAALDTANLNLSAFPTEIVKGDEVQITALPKGNVYTISPSDYLVSQQGNIFTVQPEQKITYTVMFADSAFAGCFKSQQITLDLLNFVCKEPYIYVPNAFTPNGDGENDVLYVRGKNITKLYFAIFNRWGEKVFETTNQHLGWDGVYKGMAIDPAVYDYYLRYECEGEEEEYFKKGNITLIR